MRTSAERCIASNWRTRFSKALRLKRRLTAVGDGITRRPKLRARLSAGPMITDHRHSGGRSGAALRPVERVTAAALYHALKRRQNPTIGSWLWGCENLGHLYSQTPSKHSIARPLTERQQGVLVAQESPRYPHSCGFGGGGGPLPPHPMNSSTRAARATADTSPDAAADSTDRWVK